MMTKPKSLIIIILIIDEPNLQESILPNLRESIFSKRIYDGQRLRSFSIVAAYLCCWSPMGEVVALVCLYCGRLLVLMVAGGRRPLFLACARGMASVSLRSTSLMVLWAMGVSSYSSMLLNDFFLFVCVVKSVFFDSFIIAHISLEPPFFQRISIFPRTNKLFFEKNENLLKK
jgi:hypothetical protein